jgi:hypothetical protein
MKHIKIGTTRAELTPSEWLDLGSQIGDICRVWADRDDIIAYVGPGAGGPAPACFNPQLAEIEVNVDVAFGKGISPSIIGDLRHRDTQYEWPKAAGAVFHEALHAKYSLWSLADAQAVLTRDEFEALTTLEETRIEAAGVYTMPGNRGFLRATALDIVLADVKGLTELSSTAAAAQLAGLTLARIDAGVLEEEDVEEVGEVITQALGEELLQALRSVWKRFQMHQEHYNPLPLYELAKEWAKLVSDAVKERGEDSPQEGSSSSKELIQEMLDALQESAESTSIYAGSELADQQTAEEWKEVVSEKSQKAKEAKEAKQAAQDVFASGIGTGPSVNTRTSSRLVETRNPTGPERAAAVKVAQMLDKAKYRERSETDIKSVLPPGRLRTRAIVQNAALKSKGIMAQSEPWKRTVRKHTDDPTLTVGVMVDISGSMSRAMEPMAVTAWVMSEAAKRAQARCAMAYFGDSVFATLAPGQHLNDVNVYSANDSTETFNKGFKSLDGALDLLNGSGARLLVVVSDGEYTPPETERAQQWMKRCQQSGVAVLWLSFSSHARGARRITVGTDVVLLEGELNPAEAASEIGKAAAMALTKVGTRASAA